MILVDANLLVYAVNRDAICHRPARTWVDAVMGGAVHVGLPWVSNLAFLRVTAHPNVFSNPLRPELAMESVEAWLAQPFVDAIGLGNGHWSVLRNQLRMTGTFGNLISDAHVAALAIGHCVTVYSAHPNSAGERLAQTDPHSYCSRHECP